MLRIMFPGSVFLRCTEMIKRDVLLKKLADSEGYNDVLDLLEAATFDSVVPGICVKCELTEEVEPDCRRGYCASCDGQSVISCLILAGVI